MIGAAIYQQGREPHTWLADAPGPEDVHKILSGIKRKHVSDDPTRRLTCACMFRGGVPLRGGHVQAPGRADQGGEPRTSINQRPVRVDPQSLGT